MYIVISVLILLVCFLLALFVLAQNPKGGGLAAGFTGAQQIGGVQRTADFLEKGTWSLAAGLMVLCLIATAMKPTGDAGLDELDLAPELVTSDTVDPNQVTTPPADEAGGEQAPVEGADGDK